MPSAISSSQEAVQQLNSSQLNPKAATFAPFSSTWESELSPSSTAGTVSTSHYSSQIQKKQFGMPSS
jgi:hypothetical protein